MTWVTWRLQRTETLVAAGILALLAALVIPTGLHMQSVYDADGLAACVGRTIPSQSCGLAISGFTLRFATLTSLLGWFTLTPGLIGVLLAAPFILELENGTYRLAWTQSVTRARWLATKLALPVASVLLCAGALILLLTWWRTPFAHLQGRLDTSIYDSEGTVALGYAMFALGLTLAIGAVWRRTAVAITVAFVGYIAARIFVDTWLRVRLVTPLTVTWTGGHSPPASINYADILSQSAVPSHLATVGGGGLFRIPAPGSHALPMHATYIPESDFWTLQGIETALFFGAGLLLVLFAAWRTYRRTA